MRRLNKPDKPVSVRKAINYAIVINALQIALIVYYSMRFVKNLKIPC